MADLPASESPPNWAKRLTADTPLGRIDDKEGETGHLHLFEVGRINGEIVSHISRGVLRELKVSKQELVALKKLRDEVRTHKDPKGNPHLKNLDFYIKMSKLAPRLAAMITPPAEFFVSERVEL